MAFYGPAFPNETHYETLSSARQRFGHRSANMFFVRPARHVACPRRLKYIHDITTGYVPYVEDSDYTNRSPYRYIFNKPNNDETTKNNGYHFFNSADSWRQQLIDLAQQVKSTLSTTEQEPMICSPRAARMSRYRPTRNKHQQTNGNSDENDEQSVSKRSLNRYGSPRYASNKVTKSQTDEKLEQEQTNPQEENQDSGIWLIPILCYILKFDNVLDAQDWLVNANPTEKRLAKELISRTMQDLRNHEMDVVSDISSSDQATARNFNNIYWPYKIWQKQEQDRQQIQQHQQQVLKQSKLTSGLSLPALNVDNNETCERATSPVRILTPAKRLTTGTKSLHTSVESLVLDSPKIRKVPDRTASAITTRDNSNQILDQSKTLQVRPFSTIPANKLLHKQYPPSRRGYRVATSVNRCTDSFTNPISPGSRGKTPLV